MIFPDDIRVPSKAWDLLEFKAAEEAGGGQESGGHGGGAEAPSSIGKNLIFSEVAVFLAQKKSRHC